MKKSRALINKGDAIEIGKRSPLKIKIKIEEIIADHISKICFANSRLEDEKIKSAEKFHFALSLKKCLQEKQNG